MKKRWIVLLALILVAAFALPAAAEIKFFGTARVMPTYYSNFDFNDNGGDFTALNEGGFVSGESIRGELRLGWEASGEKWKINMIAETDVTYDKNNGDRSFYLNATDIFNTNGNLAPPNAGGEFGIERVELVYTFFPWLELATGWPITAADMGSGGLLYGDDHPMIQLRGRPTENLKYELTYLSIQNLDKIQTVDSPLTNDWRVYYLKVSPTIDTGAGKLTVSPIVMLSDNRVTEAVGVVAGQGGLTFTPNGRPSASVRYYGVELLGQIGPIKPSAEFIYADGKLRPTATSVEKDIKSYAAFAAVELPVSKAFNPYVAVRYTKGDDNSSDNDVEGFVGVTDIARFTPVMGMDGNILGEHLAVLPGSGPRGTASYGAPLYGYAPERFNRRAGVPGEFYGGIGNLGSGNNPGQRVIAAGAKGEVSPALSYKAQVFLIWYDKTGNLNFKPGTTERVDKYAGTTADLLLKYAFSKNFSATYIGSVFVPGDGIKDQVKALDPNADDTFAMLHTMQLAWSY